MRLTALAFLVLSPSVFGCGGDFDGSSGGFGATPGGVKDMGLARELIGHGQVPPAAAFLVEGMFSEHDLGLDGPVCTTTLCLRAAAGVAPDGDGQPNAWIQVGLSSTIDPESWRRPSTTFIFTVDVSGSMGWSSLGGQYPTAGALARQTMLRLAPLLGAEDRVAIVTYGSSVSTPLGLTSGGDRARIAAAIEGLREGGSTNMEAGLKKAYALGGQAARDGETAQTRIILFTDVQPNVGATTPSEFERMVAAGADQDVDLTVVALGLGIGPEVLRGMAHLAGANAFSLFQGDDVDGFIADEYPWFTTPIARALRVAVRRSPGYRIDQSYGFPTGGSDAEELALEAETVFLSKRKGALLVSFAPTGGGELTTFGADLALSYRTPSGEPVSQPLHASTHGLTPDEEGRAFAQPSTARAVALALLVTGMRQAAEVYAANAAEAEEIMRAAHGRFVSDVAALAAADLEDEVLLSSRLLELIESRAPQGTLYGRF